MNVEGARASSTTRTLGVWEGVAGLARVGRSRLVRLFAGSVSRK